MMLVPAMAVVAVAFLMMELAMMMLTSVAMRMMMSMRVGVRTMLMMPLMKPVRALDLPKLGMQQQGHLNRFQVSHG